MYLFSTTEVDTDSNIRCRWVDINKQETDITPRPNKLNRAVQI